MPVRPGTCRPFAPDKPDYHVLFALSDRRPFSSAARGTERLCRLWGAWLDKTLGRPNGLARNMRCRGAYGCTIARGSCNSTFCPGGRRRCLGISACLEWSEKTHTTTSKEQGELQQRLTKEHGELQEQLDQRHENLQKYLADKDSISTRRAALVELWPYLIDIHRIDPEKSAPEEIRKAVNTLELVALCWEANIIDKEVIQRTFESTYINIYEQVLSVTRRLPSLEKTGRELLNENPAAISLYDELKKTQVGRGRVSA